MPPKRPRTLYPKIIRQQLLLAFLAPSIAEAALGQDARGSLTLISITKGLSIFLGETKARNKIIRPSATQRYAPVHPIGSSLGDQARIG